MSRDFGNDFHGNDRSERRAGGYAKGPRQNGRGKGHGDRRDGGRFEGRGASKPSGGRDGKSYGHRGSKPYGDRKDGQSARRFDGERGDRGFGSRGGRGGKGYGDRGPRGGRRFDGDRRFEDAPRERLHVDRSGQTPKRGFGRDAARGPQHGDSELLRSTLERIAGKAFGAYRDIEGTYAFDGYELSIERVQRDPFAPPSKIAVTVPQETAGFDPALLSTPARRIALQDHVLRAFAQELSKNAFSFADFIKGGAFSTSRPGPEVIERSACAIDEDAVVMRFEATFPARERSIATREFEEMFFTALPRIVRDSLLAVSYPEGELQAVADLADDQQAVREALGERGLVAFVADGAILPRESGISQRPLKDAKPFASPDSLRVTIDTPHAGAIAGMGVPAGVTLIVGGGYHGKSTLLKAIQNGVYNHVKGDGREFVICDATAVKLRAEDGRSVRGTDISLFINNLPSDIPTDSFWTDDASGSTSQAASTAEALEARSRLFLIDEDTSATNFMVREPLMQAVIAPEGEPITPFVERLRDLYEKAGVSTIIVAGSSGAFFSVADTVIQMQEYEPRDIGELVRATCREKGAAPVARAAGFARPNADRLIASPQHPLVVKTASDARKADKERREGHGAKGPERLRTKVLGGVDIRVGTVGSDMRYVEQMVDAEQAKTLACIVKACMERDLLSRMSVHEIVDEIWRELDEKGFAAVSDTRALECGMAMPRREEIFACINRLRPRD